LTRSAIAERHGRSGRQGNDYLSVKLDDPSFPAPIYASLVGAEGEDLALIWSRRRIAE
jgi:uncharacterized protein (DUF736 family)